MTPDTEGRASRVCPMHEKKDGERNPNCPDCRGEVLISDGGTSTSGTDHGEWLLILTMWPDDRRGFERPVLERISDREKAEDTRHEYAKNDCLHPSDYTIIRRSKTDTLPFDLRFDGCNDRYLQTEMEQSEADQ